MNEQFVTYEIALKLKEIGFNEPCFARFNKGNFQMNKLGDWYKHNSGEIDKSYLSASLWQQVIDWFRINHNYDIWIEHYNKDDTYIFQCPQWNSTKILGYFKTYEEAREKAILKAIEIVKRHLEQ